MRQPPEVDFLVLMHPAQSVSVYTSHSVEDWNGRQKTSRGRCRRYLPSLLSAAIAKSVGHEPLTEWKEYRFKDPFGENNGKGGVRGPKANADQVNWFSGGSASSLRGKWFPSVTCPYGGAMQVEYYGREQCIGVGQGICKDGWQFGINHYGDNTYLMLWREDDPAFPVFRTFPGATQLCIGEQYPNVAYLRVTYDDCLYYLIGPGAGDANNLARLKIVPDTQKYRPNDVIVKFRDGPGDSNTLCPLV